jgi:hypothetical protein
MRPNTNICKKLLVLAFLLSSLNSLAQPPDFVVYFVIGKANKITHDKIIPLKKRDPLYLSDKLDIEKNAQVILICRNGNITKLKGTGTQNLSDAVNQCSKAAQSFTYAYFHFIFDEFTGTSTKIDEKNYLNNLGAISRGWPVINILPDTINYCSGAIKIAWRDRMYAGTVNVFADSQASQPLKKINYTHNTFMLSSLTAGLKFPGVYFWNISSSIHQTSPMYFIKITDQANYEKNVITILQNVIQTTPAETAYMSGFLLEENHLLVEAAKYYKKAYLLEPGNLIYKNTKLRFYE